MFISVFSLFSLLMAAATCYCPMGFCAGCWAGIGVGRFYRMHPNTCPMVFFVLDVVHSYFCCLRLSRLTYLDYGTLNHY